MASLNLERRNPSYLAAPRRYGPWAFGWSLVLVTAASLGLWWLIGVAAYRLLA